MKHPWVVCALLLASLPVVTLGAQGSQSADAAHGADAADAADAAERFRIVSAETSPALRRQIDASHAAGYRVRASAQGTALNGKDRIVVLMERAADAADYAYAVVRTAGDFDEELDGKSLNAWAAEGYRVSRENLLARRIEDWWVPESSYQEQLTLLLERSPDSEPRRYTSLVVTSRDGIGKLLAGQTALGHEVIGMWNAGRALHVLVEQLLEGAAPQEPVAPNRPVYRLLIGENRLGFGTRLNQQAMLGYRVVDVVDQSIKAPPLILLKHEPHPEGPFEYASLFNPDRKIYRDKLEKKLNKRGRQGFRIAAGAITASLVVFERAPGKSRRLRFRAFSSKQPPGLPRALDAAMAGGARLIALLTYADETVAVVEQPDS